MKLFGLLQCGVVTFASLHSVVAEPRFRVGANPVCGVSVVCDGENLLQ